MSNIGNPGIFDQIYNIEKELTTSSNKIQTKLIDFSNSKFGIVYFCIV